MANNIKTGVYVGEDNSELRDQDTFLNRWNRARRSMINGTTTKSPLIYHDFYGANDQFGTTGRIKNYDGVDVFERMVTMNQQDFLGAGTGTKNHRLMITFNVQFDQTAIPSGQAGTGMKGYRKANYNVTAKGSNFTFDEHAAMLGRRMAEARAAYPTIFDFVRVRIFHEFMGRQKTDGDKGWCVFDGTGNYAINHTDGDTSAYGWRFENFQDVWKRFVAIVAGGSFSTIENRLSGWGVENANLNIDESKLEAAGYTNLSSSQTLSTNKTRADGDLSSPMDLSGDWAMVLTGNSEPNRSTDSSKDSYQSNYFSDYYPGDNYVGYVGLTFFPKDNDAKVDDMITELTNVYQNYAINHDKFYSISAYTRQIAGFINAADCSTPSPNDDFWNGAGCNLTGVGTYDSDANAARYDRILAWAEARESGKMRDLVAFEAVGANRCEDGRIGAKYEDTGNNAYGKHMTKSRDRLGPDPNNRYAFA
jgi:hypothetical protein